MGFGVSKAAQLLRKGYLSPPPWGPVGYIQEPQFALETLVAFSPPPQHYFAFFSRNRFTATSTFNLSPSGFQRPQQYNVPGLLAWKSVGAPPKCCFVPVATLLLNPFIPTLEKRRTLLDPKTLSWDGVTVRCSTAVLQAGPQQ